MRMVLLCMISRASEEVDLGVICAAEGRPRATHDTSIRLEPCNCSSSAFEIPCPSVANFGADSRRVAKTDSVAECRRAETSVAC
jgi:hypothetical protein